MRLLASALPELRRLLPSGDGLVTLTFASLLVALELAGRSAWSDLHDGLAALALGSGIALVASRHRRQPLAWVDWAARRVRRAAGRVGRARYDHGIDLRGAPPFPRRVPPAVWWVVAGLAGWAGVAAGAWAAFPLGWREAGVRTSYVAYLLALLVVWAGLLACTFAGVYAPVLVLDRWLRRAVREADRKAAELVLVAGYGVAVAAVAYFLPTAVVLVVCLAMAAGAGLAAARPGGDEPAVLWRAGPGRPIYAVPLRRIVAGGLGLAALVVFDLLLTACGGRLLTPPDPADTMPVTALLGTTAAWMIPGLVVAGAVRLAAGLRTDPARRTPPTVHLRGHGPAGDRRRAAGVVAGWGWAVRPAADPPEPGDAQVELVRPEESEAAEFDPRWPLKVSLADLESGRVKDRLARRDEIQVRRQLFRGLSALFKRAAADRGRRGGGYWVAPHWWFITGLDREDPHRGRSDKPAAPRPVGPPFGRALGPRARQHVHRVFRAVQVDMVFVEDGVSYRSFEKVLRAVFELYDVHAGARKAEDHLFRGVPKVRVMVHEYAPGKPFRATGYREPQFDDLSRARVLHVFRDSGGQEAETETPWDTSWEPSPALGVG